MSWFCSHKWKEKERIRVKQEAFDGKIYDGLIIILECKKCGKLKKVRII